jgi:hypothetical protein
MQAYPVAKNGKCRIETSSLAGDAVQFVSTAVPLVNV